MSALADNQLSVYMWEDTIAPRVIEKWYDTSSINLNFSHFDNDDERSLLMLNSISLPFDVMVLDNVSAHVYSENNSLENVSSLENLKHIDPTWKEACGVNAVPYFWGTVGVTYRKSKVASPPTTWQEFIEPANELQGHIGMINDSVETLLPALKALNLSPITDSETELKQAYQRLIEFNQHVLTYEYSLSYIRSQENADKLYIALAYSGDHYSLNRYFANNDWAYTALEDPLFLWVDCLAIRSSSPNKKAAKEFLNYLLRPDIAAINANYIKSATPNLSAIKLLPTAYVNDASLFPSSARRKNAIIDSALSAQNIGTRAKIINSLIKRHEAQY